MPTTEEQLIIDEALRALSPEKDPEVAKALAVFHALSLSGHKAFKKEIDPHGRLYTECCATKFMSGGKFGIADNECAIHTNRKTPRMRPESEWVVSEDANLRIVPQDLWDRVQERIKAKALGNWNTEKPRVKYLLSSLLKCEVCGANFVMPASNK